MLAAFSVSMALIALAPDAKSAAMTALTPTVDEIADRMFRVYQNAKFIRLEGRTASTDQDVELRYIYEGTPEGFWNLCYKDGELLDAFSWHNGRIQEFDTSDPTRPLIEHDGNPEFRGVANRKIDLPANLVCLYGQQTVFWIGPNLLSIECSTMPRVAAERIREGTLRDQFVSVGDHLCYLVDWQQEWVNSKGETIINDWRFYVDTDEYLLRRFDSDYTALHDANVVGTEERDFIYDVVEISNESRKLNYDIWPLVKDHVPSKREGSDLAEKVNAEAGDATQNGS